jgi:glycosyltransferase involved in cell wall biosynthesis
VQDEKKYNENWFIPDIFDKLIKFTLQIFHHNPLIMNKKILLCSNILWTITQFRLGLIKALVKEGYEVVCVADTDDFSVLSETKIADTGARFVRLVMNRKGTNPFSDLKYLFKLKKILKLEKPAIVINYTIKPVIYGSISARLLHIPSLAVTTGLGFVFNSNNLLTRFTRLLYKFSLRFPSKVFFLNTDDREIFLQNRIIPMEKSLLLPSEGIDTDYYQPIPTSPEERDFTFLLIARLLWEKGVGEYVEAARILRSDDTINARFLLIGYIDSDNPGGISKTQIQQWSDEGIIEYRGTAEDIRNIISESDCIVLPSYYREGVPRTLLEAASMAKPIITTNNVGCREVIDNGINGFICNSKDSTNLSDVMREMIRLTPEKREKMGQSGRNKILSQFDEKIVINIYLKEIEQALNISSKNL